MLFCVNYRFLPVTVTERVDNAVASAVGSLSRVVPSLSQENQAAVEETEAKQD